MNRKVFISYYLDTRRTKKSNKYPLKLRVFLKEPRMQKFFTTKFEFSEKEFQSIWESQKPRLEHKPIRQQLQIFLNNAELIAEKIQPFSFDEFERKIFNESGAGENVIWQYEQQIIYLRENARVRNAIVYELSLNSLKKFIEYEKGTLPSKLTFSEITPKWLERYENYMTKVKKSSLTTVGIYLRALRAIFNIAIKQKDISPELYPFGKDSYVIPTTKNVKKALSKEQLKLLFDTKPTNPEQEKAKDFWFFSYSCNGMNFKDIVLLKYENLDNDKLIFYRSKTINTRKQNLTPVTVYLTEFAMSIIKKYGNPDKTPGNYIFPILSTTDSPIEQYRKINNFIRFINQHLKKLAKNAGIPPEISTYWARHSFATNAIRSGASMEFVSEALNHSDLKTTKAYFAGFADDTKKDFAETLMKF